MQFTSVSGQQLKQQFIELHRGIIDDEDFKDELLLNELFEHWVETLLASGDVQFASMNN